MIGLISLCSWVVSQELIIQHHDYGSQIEQQGSQSTIGVSNSTYRAGIWILVFACYCLFIHALLVLFPLRACWSIWSITRALKRYV